MDQRTSFKQSKLEFGEAQDNFKPKSEAEDGGASLPEDKDVDFIQNLLKEKLSLDQEKHPNILRLINKELDQFQKSKSQRDVQYVDIYREKPIKLSAKVLVPVKVHPNFNFVGKLLGPKGSSLKRLQEETQSRMFILGRGSMKDKEKEEELRQSLDPKYAHLSDDLHVEISVLASPAEAHAKMALALVEIRKYLIPDYYDEIRREQMQQIKAEHHTFVPSIGHGSAMPSRAAMPPAPMHRGIATHPFAGKSVLRTVRLKAAAYGVSSDAYNFYDDEAEKWKNYNDYGNGRDYYNGDYSGGASSYNGYNNFAANKANNGRNGRRLL